MIINFNALRGTMCELRGVTPDIARLGGIGGRTAAHNVAAAAPKTSSPAMRSLIAAPVDDAARQSHTYMPESGSYVDDLGFQTSPRGGGGPDDAGRAYDELGNPARGGYDGFGTEGGGLGWDSIDGLY